MLLDRWRARRAILTRSAPSPVGEEPHPQLVELIERLAEALRARGALGRVQDPCWHLRWEGQWQLVGLQATSRSVTDVRQRLLRLLHEIDLRHLPKRARRVLAVVRCELREGEDLAGWHARLQNDRGEVGVSDWKAARRRISVLAVSAGGTQQLFGEDPDAAALVSTLT